MKLGWAVSIVGFAMFAYGYWDARLGYERHPDWLIIIFVFAGIAMGIFGLWLIPEATPCAICAILFVGFNR